MISGLCIFVIYPGILVELLAKLKLCGIETHFREQLKSNVITLGEFLSFLGFKAAVLFSYCDNHMLIKLTLAFSFREPL